ncbi:MAG: trigger factor [Pseudomonadales bacterium]
MQVSIQTTSGLERKLTVGVPAERVDNEVNARLQKAAGTVRLDGFRPGKIPMNIMKQRFGAGIRQEVVQEVMSQSFQEAVVKEQLKPAGMPSIEPKSIAAGADLEFVATFEVFPEVEAKDYSSMVIEKPVAEVSDTDIDNMIETLRKQRATWAVIDQAAAQGNRVNIDYVGTKEGEPFDGGSANGTDLELGSKRMIPGFEDGLVGTKAGETKVLSLSFPEDYHAEELKGAAVEFSVTVNTVSEQILAELGDELFAQFDITEGGVDKFRIDIADNMKRELANATKAKIKKQVMDSLVDIHDDLQLPQSLIKQEITVLKEQMAQQFNGSASSLDVDSLLPDELFTDRAGRRVRLGLVLNDYISKEGLSPDPEKVKATIEGFAVTYEDPEEVINHYYSNQQKLHEIQSMVLEDTVVEKLLDQATVTEKAYSYDDVLATATTPEASGEE